MKRNGLVQGIGSLRQPDAALLKAVLDSIPGRVSIVDTEDRYLFANQELLNFFGRPESDLIGRRIVEILGEAAMQAFAPSKEKVLRGEVAKFEGWVDYLGKGRRYVKQVFTPYKSGDGKVEGFFFVGRDQTEQKEREIELARQSEALRVSEMTRAAVVLSSLDPIVVTDETGKILEFNPAAEITFGYARSFAVGRMIADLIIPPGPSTRDEAGLRWYLTSGQPALLGRRVEVEAMRADHSTFPAELSVTEMRMTSGQLFAAHIRDLTEAKTAQAEIERQRDRLHQAEKLAAMGSLLASVAHELNNPLAIVIAQSTLLDMKAESEQVKQRAERIHAAAQRCGRIVKSFLAMARQKPPERRAVDLNEIVKAALELSEYGRRSAGIEMVLELDPALPRMEADPDLLGQVVTNLLLNATQAVRDHRQPRRVWVSTAEKSGVLTLVVADNGPGVPAGLKDRIFEPYFTSKPLGVGTGIGLSISKNIVEAHGGRIEVHDREGGGAVFEVVFPVDAVTADEPEMRAEGAGRRHRVLIVDDEADVGQSLAEILVELGHAATLEANPEKALTTLKAGKYDLVFADLHMPGLNGLDLRDRISHLDADLSRRTIIVTGDTLTGGDAVAARAGPSDVIVLEKPFTPSDVQNALRLAWMLSQRAEDRA